MPKSGSISRLLAASLAAALLLGGIAVVPASAAETFNLAYVEAPRYVMNDHTPFGVRFSADASSALEPNTTYYMKVRFSPKTTPQNVSNRGFTWNDEAGAWSQERGEWFDCPTITTKADGSIENTWIYGKFGDETKSGDYYLIISLSKLGAASTYNSLDPRKVTVLDAATGGSWIHNAAAATGTKLDAGRFAVRESTSTGDQDGEPAALLSLWETEFNGIDDDANGFIDDANENQGPAATLTGDYRSSVPSNTVVDIYIKRAANPAGQDFTTGPADCDIAVGATDIVPPSAATDVTATPQPGAVELTWTPTTDAGGSGLAGYHVYRWPTEITVSPGYTTNPAVLIGSSAVTSFTDTTARAGIEYAYRVRAVDGDTNVSPRSNTATVIALGSKDLSRDFGSNRYDTALAVSRSTFATGSVETTVVIATGEEFADALAGSSLAGVHGSPLLLVGPTVTPQLTAEIDRLGATDVVLVGGTGPIPQSIQDALAAKYNVKRVAGLNRYETAAEVAREVAAFGGNTGEAYFVRGDDFADAIAVSPFAYNLNTPVLLVQTTGVTTWTETVINELGIGSGMIAGGTGAVDADTAADLETLLGAPLVRWAGATRFETASLAAQYHVAEGLATYNYVGIATGYNFPDALGGGAAAGASGGVLLLTRVDSLVPETKAVIEANAAFIDEVHVFGGVGAVNAAVYDLIADALQ
ncbi:MAG: cell wall-binding repeat-containing protein [Coriobacteriia bacterium]